MKEFDMTIEEEIKRHYVESKKIINEAQREKQLVIFVGSGASISAGMPSWGSAVHTIADHLGIGTISTDDYLRIPQYYYNSRDKKEYTQLMQEVFLFRKYLQNQPLHDLIIKFNTHTIITTNYDHLIEQAAEHNGEMIRVVSKDSDLPYRKSGRELIKMHGDFENDNFVLKEDDYLSYSKDFKLIENYVKSIIGTKVVLFIGYSFNDPDIKHIFSWAKDILHGDFQPAYFINTSDSFDVDAERYFKNLGINVIYSSIQLGSDHQEKDETHRLESMLRWLLEKDRKSQLDDLYDRLKVFKYFNYAYESKIESAFRSFGYRIDYGYIAVDSIPGQQAKYLEKCELLNRIVAAIAYERSIKDIESVYVRTTDDGRITYKIEKEYEASNEEKDSILGLLDVLNKSGVKGMIFFVPIDKCHPLMEKESVFMGYHRIFVDFDETYANKAWIKYTYTFDDRKLKELINENNKRLNTDTPDLYMEQASIYLYFEEFLSAYNCLRTASSLYYKMGESVKYFIAETNRYYIGIIIQDRGFLLGIPESDINDVIKEIEALNLEMTYWSLPDLGKGSDILKEICSFDISFKFFQDAYNISEKVKEQAATRYNLFSGLPAFSVIRRNVIDFYQFEIQNYILLDRYRENNLIYKLFFQSMMASAVAPDLGKEDNDGEAFNVHADTITDFELFIALKYITYKDLEKSLKEITRLPVENEGISYLEKVLNCIDEPHAEWVITRDFPFWKAILLLGHMEVSGDVFELAMEKICEFARDMYYRDYKNAIIKLVDNAETLGIIDEKSIIFIRNILDELINFLASEGKNETRSLLNMVVFLSYICQRHGSEYSDTNIIQKLLSNESVDLCLELYPFIGNDAQKVIEDSYKTWEPSDVFDDYTIYCVAVGNDIIQPNNTIEKRIIEYINTEKNGNENKENETQSKNKAISFGEAREPNYIRLLRLLCDLHLRNRILNNDFFIQVAKDIGDDFSMWLLDIDSFDYSKFNLAWLDLCLKPLLEDIGKSDIAKEKIGEKIAEAYNKGNADKKMLDRYFQFFSM